jgi:circadian clock protein KaiC
VTGVRGLDLILGGGLEPGAVVVVAGAPGTGKTILAQQICFAVGTTGHKGVFYTTVSEPDTKLVRHLEQFSFFDKGSLGSRVEHIHLGDFLRPARPDGLGALVSEIVWTRSLRSWWSTAPRCCAISPTSASCGARCTT